MSNARRVIAGLGADGKSGVVADDAIPQAGEGGMAITNLFIGRSARVDNAAPVQPGFPPFDMEQLTGEVYSFMVAEYPPMMGQDDPGMHFTNTADHFFILEGEVVLVLESGDVVLKAGDVGICRGVMHGWRNDTDSPVRLVTMVLPATPQN